MVEQHQWQAGQALHTAVSRLLLPKGEDRKHKAQCTWVRPMGGKNDRKARGDVAKVTSIVNTPDGKTWAVVVLYIEAESTVRLGLVPSMLSPSSDVNAVWDASCHDVSLPATAGNEPDGADFDSLRAKCLAWLAKEHKAFRLSMYLPFPSRARAL